MRDFAQAMRNFFGGTHRRPTWRKAEQHEGFRQVGVRREHVRRLNRRHGQVWVPKVGWVRFRWTCRIPDEVRSYRVTRDRAGRWHIAFAVVPDPIPAPGTGQVVGVDRGVAVSAALSTGELLHVPTFSRAEQRRVLRLQRRLARCQRGSHRRATVKAALASLAARAKDRRKDWVEKVSTDLARRFDVIRVEGLRVKDMTRSARGTPAEPGRRVGQKAGLNRAILTHAWGLLVSRLEHKAAGRVEKVEAAYTSRTCSACGHCVSESRESQASFRCVACGFRLNADVNAALNIAAGRVVTARGALQPLGGAVNREPQRGTVLAG